MFKTCSGKTCVDTICEDCENLTPSMCGSNGVNYPKASCGAIHFDGVDDVTLNQGVGIDLTNGVVAYDKNGNEIDYTVEPTEIAKCDVGEHTVTYTATGADLTMHPTICQRNTLHIPCADTENTVSVERVVTIEQADPPHIDIPDVTYNCEADVCEAKVSGTTIEPNTDFDPMDGVSAVDDNGNSVDVTYDGEYLKKATGTIASFTTDIEAPAHSLTVSIEPVQSGSGTPSPDNVRPISGWTEVDSYVSPDDIYEVGLKVDYENRTFTRLGDAVGKAKGDDFSAYGVYGNRRKCVVDDEGTINAFYGESGYVEDGSNGQVMVYQPKFYYKVVPIKLEAQSTTNVGGYHMRCGEYWISNKPLSGYKLHPAFYDKNGVECDYILIGAYEGSLYDTSAGAYITDDSQVMNASEDLFCSIANVKPASGLTQNLTKPNVETMCKNRGTGFHSHNIKTASMEQMLMMIELGTLNFQTAIGKGVCDKASGSGNEAENTGMCASIGNGTGMASGTNGLVSICYRGLENFYSNIWNFVYGINIWGNGSMGGGQPYICKDFNYAESKNSDNYEGAGFTLMNASGYINAMGYSTKYDWLFLPSEAGGNSSLPVGDYTWVTADLNAYRIAALGGSWDRGLYDGGFCWRLADGVGARSRHIGGRLVYVPTAKGAEEPKYTTTLPQTVYGGTLDVVSGVLTVDRASVTLDGSSDELWARHASGSASAYAMRLPMTGVAAPYSESSLMRSNYLESLMSSSTWGNSDAFVSSNENNVIICGIKTITTVEDWKAYLAENPLQVCYYLATPQTYQLTPQEVQLLLGQNNVWSNAGEVEVVYKHSIPQGESYQYIEEGNYTITYEAEDECGNKRTVTRDIVVKAE